MASSKVQAEVLRFSRLLESVVRVSKTSVRRLENQLDMGAGSLSRIFAGKIDLKMRHILRVLEQLDIPPEEFFRMAYRKSGGTSEGALARDLLDLLESRGLKGRPEAIEEERAEESIPDDELDRRIEEALKRMGLDVKLQPRRAGRGRRG